MPLVRFDILLRLLGHVPGRGRDFFRLACDHDREGIVAKWARGAYHTDNRDARRVPRHFP